MRQMNKKTNTAILLISHDLGVVSVCAAVFTLCMRDVLWRVVR